LRFFSTSPGSRKLAVLAPSESAVPGFFAQVHTNPSRYESLLAEMQTLRGRLYLQDGAIEPEQLTDGRHQLDTDRRSWHLLLLDKDDRVAGCMRYREYPLASRFSAVSASHSALAGCPEWSEKLEAAVESELALSRRMYRPYVEAGGWALTEEIRGTAEALRMALATYALAQSLAGGVAISTVTRRYCSASILRRIGGRSLQHDGVELPSYYDPQYKCEMEILRFYHWAPNPRYRVWIREIRSQLRASLVLSDCAKAFPSLSSPRSRIGVSPPNPLLATW
jgi:hypothetical protein